MTRAVVTITMTEAQARRLESYCEVTYGGWGVTGVRLSERELLALCTDADILLVGYETVSARLIEKARNLKLLGCARGTPVNIDLDAAARRDIPVLYTPGRNSTAAAEFTLGLMLAETRHIARSYHALRTGHYLSEPDTKLYYPNPQTDVVWNLDGESPYKVFHGCELSGKTLGLVGFGNIGSRVAQLAHAFDMRVIVYSPYHGVEKAGVLDVQQVEFKELLEQSDFISLHCKVTPETQGMIGRREFAMMKPSAYLINTARAAIVDQEALVEALKNHRIAGAALDVFWYEPLPCNHPLLQLDNVTLTPHLAGATVEVAERHSKMLVDGVVDWLEERQPKFIYK